MLLYYAGFVFPRHFLLLTIPVYKWRLWNSFLLMKKSHMGHKPHYLIQPGLGHIRSEPPETLWRWRFQSSGSTCVSLTAGRPRRPSWSIKSHLLPSTLMAAYRNHTRGAMFKVVPEYDALQVKRVLDDARGGHSDPQHVLLRGHVRRVSNAIQWIQVTEKCTKISLLIKSIVWSSLGLKAKLGTEIES